jgi:hypothetical protein
MHFKFEWVSVIDHRFWYLPKSNAGSFLRYESGGAWNLPRLKIRGTFPPFPTCCKCVFLKAFLASDFIFKQKGLILWRFHFLYDLLICIPAKNFTNFSNAACIRQWFLPHPSFGAVHQFKHSYNVPGNLMERVLLLCQYYIAYRPHCLKYTREMHDISKIGFTPMSTWMVVIIIRYLLLLFLILRLMPTDGFEPGSLWITNLLRCH